MRRAVFLLLLTAFFIVMGEGIPRAGALDAENFPDKASLWVRRTCCSAARRRARFAIAITTSLIFGRATNLNPDDLSTARRLSQCSRTSLRSRLCPLMLASR